MRVRVVIYYRTIKPEDRQLEILKPVDRRTTIVAGVLT